MLLNSNNKRINLFSFLFSSNWFLLTSTLEKKKKRKKNKHLAEEGIEFTDFFLDTGRCDYLWVAEIFSYLGKSLYQWHQQGIVNDFSISNKFQSHQVHHVLSKPARSRPFHQLRRIPMMGKLYKDFVKSRERGRSPWMVAIFSPAFSSQPLPL